MKLATIKEFVVSPSIVIIIEDVGLRSMRIKYKEENSSLCRNCSEYWLWVCQFHQALLN